MKVSPVAIATVTAAAMAWMPGVAPTPWRLETVERHVPSWVQPADCVFPDVVPAPEEVPAHELVGQLERALACEYYDPEHRATLRLATLAQSALELGEPRAAIAVWAMGQDMTRGDLFSQWVGLDIQRRAVEQLAGDLPDEWVPAVRELAARQPPPGLAPWADHERHAMSRDWDQLAWLARAHRWLWVAQTEQVARELAPVLRGPRAGREARVDAILGDTETGRGWGPLALATHRGRRAVWTRGSGRLVREIVRNDIAVCDGAAALIRGR